MREWIWNIKRGGEIGSVGWHWKSSEQRKSVTVWVKMSLPEIQENGRILKSLRKGLI